MTNATAEKKLEQLLRVHELGWMIDLYSPSDEAAPKYLRQLDEFAAAYQRRFGERALIEPDQLEAWANKDPFKVTAFLQALAVTEEPEMLQLVWCMLCGAEVLEVNLQHRQSESFNLKVILSMNGRTETFQSGDIKSAAILSHFGITTMNGRPLFQGFFALA